LFETEDYGSTWSHARTLPGREAVDLDSCGGVLIARARVDDDYFYHRSFDHGISWRPFRLGAIGLEGPSAMLRCATERGGIEAGRHPLPSHWSLDGGRTWKPAPYDATSHTLARAAESTGADHDTTRETPHCMAGPARLTQCVDSGRLRLLDAHGRAQEIHGPSSCEHVRQIDARRTFAFGSSCGLFISSDRGGVWRMVSQSMEPATGRAAGAFAEGRGGFINARTAWRLDGGVWWTFDGGESWHPFTSIGERALERGVFVDSRRGVFATSTGWVMATRDGGRHWSYVLRGEVERIASSHRSIMVTTTQSERISPDGGVTWLTAGALPPQSPLDPTVELTGSRRSISLAAGGRVTQENGTVDVLETSNDSTIVHVARELPHRYRLLAAHQSPTRQIDRILLDSGTELARGANEPVQPHARGERTHVRRSRRR
jgi:photosystem II stability/assembly factor-like uncharacterized protein